MIEARLRGRDREGAAPRGLARLDFSLLAALLALAGFLGASIHGTIHRHSHATHDRTGLSYSESAAAARPSCSHEERHEAPAAPAIPQEDHDCPICQLAGEARAPLPAEPIAPPRTDEPRAAHPPVVSSAPAAPILLAARPRAPPASS